MAFTTAQLASAITASQTTFALTGISANQSGLPTVGAIALPIGMPMQIDNEIMFCIAQPIAGTVQVRGRGSESTLAAAHDVLANVVSSAAPGDFPALAPGQVAQIAPSDDATITIGQDQTLVVPSGNTIYNINKATALALTLPAPSVALNGLTLIFTSTTAVAHVITATSLFMDGTGTLPHSTATFAAKQGASMTIIAENGLWNFSAATNNVTLT